MKKTTLFPAIASAAALLTGSVHAATISVPDYILSPDGSNSVFEQNSALGSTVLPAGGTSLVYMVATYNFGTSSDVHLAAHFAASTSAWQDRVGARVQDNGLVEVYGGGPLQANSTFDLAQDLAGQSVTLLFKLDYDVNRSTTNADDTFMEIWVNPTGSSIEGSSDINHTWNSASFPGFVQRIENQNTLNTAGDSSITGVSIFTEGDATFANALGQAIPEPSSTALLGLGGLALILRRRR